jgi:hypothetical protein
MILEKQLLIDEFSHRRFSNVPYLIKAISSDFDSKILINEPDLKKYGITPSLDLTGKKLNILLESRQMQKGEGQTITDLTLEDLYIACIEKKETIERHGLGFDRESGGPCFNKFGKAVYSAHLKNTGLYNSGYQSPSYDLHLELDSQEYNEMIALPNNLVMRMNKMWVTK